MNIFRNSVLAILISLLFLSRAAGTDGNNSPNGVIGDYNGSVTTAGSYDPLTGNANRMVEDIAVTGSVGAYPLKWVRRLNTRAKLVGAGFGQAGGWNHSYDWKLKILHRAPPPPPPPNSSPPPEMPDGKISYPDGRAADLYEPWNSNGCDAAEEGLFGMQDRLLDRGDGHYDLLLADGGVVKFSGPVSGNVALPLAREIIDQYGRSTTLERDSENRLKKIIEPGGRYLEIFYGPHQGQFGTLFFIDSVTANDGLGHVTQTVSYSYATRTYLNYWVYYLYDVDYHDGTFAHYRYQDTNMPPLYTGDPSAVNDGLISTCDDVRFAGPMKKIKYEFRDRHAASDVAWGQIFRERRFGDNDQVLSELEYSNVPAYEESWRREHRPDGSTREFRYQYTMYLTSYSDFEEHWSQNNMIPNPTGNSHYQFTDARLNMTDKEIEGVSDFKATVRVTHPAPDNSFVTMTYSDPLRPHYLEYRTDENGKTTHYFRDDRHRVWRIEYPDYPANGFEEFTYNNFDQILTHTMTSSGVEHFQYDNNNRGLKTLSWPPATSSDDNPGGHPTQYFYYGGPSGPGEAPEAAERPDLIDRLRRVIDPRGNSTWYEYNPRGQVTRVSHEDGTGVRSDYNDDGTLAWTTDELWHTTTYTYDDYKRVTEVKNHLNETVSNSYTPWNGLGPYSHTTSSVYQTLHMLEHVDYDYDHNFRRTTTIQAPDHPLDEIAITTSTYDAVGNLETVTEPNGQPGKPHAGKKTTFGYDCRNRQTSVTNALDEITTIKYDSAGNKTREARPDNTLRSWDYDSMNRLWHAYDWRMNETPTLAQTTTYVRDPAGNALSVTDTKGAVYRFGYDVLNRKTSATYPHDSTLPERTEAWLYDFAGNVKLHKNPANQYQHFEYDTRNRQRRSYWNLSINDNTAAIQSVGLDIRTTLDDASRMTEIQTNDGATIVGMGYDAANRKLWEDQTVAGQPTHRVKTDLDPDGRRTTLQIIDPPTDGLTVSPEMSGSGSYSISYTYTHRNQLKRIQGESGEDWAFDYAYDASGNMTSRTAVSSSGQSSATNSPNYDALNRPETWEQTGASGRISLSHYQYDHMNREEATWREEECYLGDCNLGERFTYEPTNQLSSAKYNAKNVWTTAPQNAERSVDYAYTINKLNRGSMTVTPRSGPPVVTNYSPNALNQYTGVGGMSYTYDNNFNLAATGAFFGMYDAANRLVSASNSGGEAPAVIAEFVYDGLGRCVKRTLNSVETVFLYDGWKPIAEWYAAKPDYFQAWNVYGPGADEILLRQQGDIGYVRFHLDRHGNVAFLVYNSGVMLEKCSYDAFGKATVRDANGQRPRSWSYYAHGFLFQGREYIRELGIYDYRNRFYHPETGRFLQTDPTGFDAGDMNLFRYCDDDPVDLSDPSGLEPMVISPELRGAMLSGMAQSLTISQSNSDGRGKGLERGKNILLRGGKFEVGKNTSVGQKVGNHQVVPPPPIEGGTRAAYVHAHTHDSVYTDGNLMHRASSSRTSDADKNWADANNKPIGTITPGWRPGQVGTREIYSPSTNAEERAHHTGGGTERLEKDGWKQLKEGPRGNTSPSNASSGPSANASSGPSAQDIDMAHQATGVPSQGQEAVNVVNGPR